MVENHNPNTNESKPLTTETEVLAPEATADHTGLSSESTATQPHETIHEASSALRSMLHRLLRLTPLQITAPLLQSLLQPTNQMTT